MQTREEIQEYQRNYRKKNHDKALEYGREYYTTNREALIQKASLYKKQNRARYNEYSRTRRNRVLELLGGKCLGCGIADLRVLQIDHVNNDGYKEKLGIHRKSIVESILCRRRSTDDLQILCANCHWIKTRYGEEP